MASGKLPVKLSGLSSRMPPGSKRSVDGSSLFFLGDLRRMQMAYKTMPKFGTPTGNASLFLILSFLRCRGRLARHRRFGWFLLTRPNYPKVEQAVQIQVVSKEDSPSLVTIIDCSTLTTCAILGPPLISWRNFLKLASSPCASPSTLRVVSYGFQLWLVNQKDAHYKTITYLAIYGVLYKSR